MIPSRIRRLFVVPLLLTAAGCDGGALAPEGEPPAALAASPERLRGLTRTVERLEAAPPDGADAARAELLGVLFERAALLTRVAEVDPQAVLDAAFTPATRARLAAQHPEAGALLERPVRLEGRVRHLVEDHAHGRARSLLFLDAAGHPTPIRLSLVRPPEDIASGAALTVEGLLAPGAAILAAGDAQPSASAASASAPSSCPTTGVQNTAVIVVVAPGETQQVSNAQLEAWFFGAAPPSVDGYLRDASYQQTSAAGAVFGPYTLDRAYSCSEYDSALRSKVVELADGDIHFPDYQRIFIVYDAGVYPTECSWNGVAYIGCWSWSDEGNDGPYTASYAWLNSSSLVAGGPNGGPNDGLTIAIHELGHGLGIQHAQSRDYGPETLAAPGVGGTTLDEYGDLHSVMGGGRVFGFGRFTHFAAPHKVQLGWLGPEQVTTVEADGTFLISPYENLAGAGVRALKIRRPGVTPDQWLWAELRQPIGDYDSTALAGAFDGALFHHEVSTTGTKTQLLDFTPLSDSLDFADAPLAADTSWQDAYTGLGLSVAAAGEDLAIGVSYGPAPCVAAAPSLSITPLVASTTAGQAVTFDVTVSGNDTGTCPAVQAFSLSPWASSGLQAPSVSSPNPFGVPWGGSAVATLTQTTHPAATVGDYSVTVASPRGGTSLPVTATLTIVPSVSVSVPGSAFPKNSYVLFSAQVMNGGAGAPNASVTFSLLKPNGSIQTQVRTTDAGGVATWSYRVTAKGAHSLSATGTVQGKTGVSNSAAFTVY